MNRAVEKEQGVDFSMGEHTFQAVQQSEVNETDSRLAEKILGQALRDFRKEKIKKEIDQSLENRNKEEFLRLTKELKEIS